MIKRYVNLSTKHHSPILHRTTLRYFTIYHDTLNLKVGASVDEIRHNYLQLARQWHPDKFQNKSEAEIQEAQEKYRKIRNAYEKLKEEPELGIAKNRGTQDPSRRYANRETFTRNYAFNQKDYDEEYRQDRTKTKRVNHERVDWIGAFIMVGLCFGVYYWRINKHEKERQERNRLAEQGIYPHKEENTRQLKKEEKRMKDHMSRKEYIQYRESKYKKLNSLFGVQIPMYEHTPFKQNENNDNDSNNSSRPSPSENLQQLADKHNFTKGYTKHLQELERTHEEDKQKTLQEIEKRKGKRKKKEIIRQQKATIKIQTERLDALQAEMDDLVRKMKYFQTQTEHLRNKNVQLARENTELKHIIKQANLRFNQA